MKPSAQRLYDAAEKLHGIRGLTEVARLLDEKQQTVKNWESRGVSKAGMIKAQQKIGCSAEWLESGLGNMDIGIPKEVKNIPEGYILLTIPDVLAAAGAGSFNPDYPEILYEVTISEKFLSKIGILPKNARLLTIRGDSMSPTAEDKDVAIYDNSITSFQGEGIYVFDYADDGLRIKRLQKMLGNKIAVKSDNNKYDTEIIEGEALNRLYIRGKVGGFLYARHAG